jgi:hypothetical protein
MARFRRRQHKAAVQAAGTLGQCLTVTLVLLASLPAVAISGSDSQGQPAIRMQAADVLASAPQQLIESPAALSVSQAVLECCMVIQELAGHDPADTRDGFSFTCAPVRGP